MRVAPLSGRGCLSRSQWRRTLDDFRLHLTNDVWGWIQALLPRQCGRAAPSYVRSGTLPRRILAMIQAPEVLTTEQ